MFVTVNIQSCFISKFTIYVHTNFHMLHSRFHSTPEGAVVAISSVMTFVSGFTMGDMWVATQVA